MTKKLKVGLFGFGCVGQGLYYVLNNSTGFKADIVKIAVKDRTKERIVSHDLITFDKWDILNNSEIDVIVELIDDAEEAFSIVKEAMIRGKHVVTANKKMLALNLAKLFELQAKHNVSLLYEGSAGGSIPIIRTLEEYFDNEELNKVSGIFNGTSNYILTKTITNKMPYAVALKQAQELGFAETDPTNDVEGFDPKFKAVIIALHAFGTIIEPEQILNLGITTLDEKDILYAAEKGLKIKLVPVIQKLNSEMITAFVIPGFVKETEHLFNVENEFNGVVVEGKFSGEQFLQGKGAGSHPTGAAVLSDISALSHGYRYEYKKRLQKNIPSFTNEVDLTVYLRFNNKVDLDKLDFTEILEKYNGTDYNFVVGKISLNSILKNRDYILNQKLFVCLVNSNIDLSKIEIGQKNENQLDTLELKSK